MDSADLELFERSLRHATEQHTGDTLDTALAELGWHDAVGIEPQAAISLLFELQGRANSTSSALDAVLRQEMGVEAGSAVGVVLPAAGRYSPPGAFDGARLTIRGLGSAALAGHDTALVVAADGEKHLTMTVGTKDLALRPVGGVDPHVGLVEVTGEVVPTDSGPADWRTAVALGQVALGHELAGAARRMLELAREHAVERIQFGRPISMFQAVRHRLADTLVAIEMADAVLGAAWLDQSPQTAAIAKAVAGRSARTAARHCQQVLGGIGFTTEHPFHRYVWRVLVLDTLFGTARTLTEELGSELRRTRQLPAPVPL